MDEVAAKASVKLTRPAAERSHPAGHQMRFNRVRDLQPTYSHDPKAAKARI